MSVGQERIATAYARGLALPTLPLGNFRRPRDQEI